VESSQLLEALRHSVQKFHVLKLDCDSVNFSRIDLDRIRNDYWLSITSLYTAHARACVLVYI